ncbi:MAG: CDP-alcohol phosphatidyltransferase family protein [Desulfurivibrionaceae bacterium]|nr:CDP-alcohol phosphatidyltransferase family protein [Desulfobulbales bacterium]MDT8335103.1 CDP-alcohol phosphatidyltransferase family protein [Desulfurivibrionaceae bacterium]
MNVPNSITLFRIILVPVMLYFLIEGENLSALIVFVVAALSDGLDGFFAKILNQKTRLGAFLDPIADKLLLSTSFIVLAVFGLAPTWLAIMVVSRDLLIITGIGILAWDNDFPAIQPTIDGKITTFLQVLTIGFLLSQQYIGSYQWLYHPLITSTGLFTAISGTRYMLIGFRLLGDGK